MFIQKKYIVLFYFLLINLTLWSQYKFEWNDYYDNNSMEEVASMTKTSDGNLMIVGTSNRETNRMWLVKINPNGDQLWSKIYSDFISISPVKIIESKDHNFIITSIISEKDTLSHKLWLIKVNQEGKVLWEKIYPGNGDVYCTDIVETYDKGIAISGYSAINVDEKPDWYLLKVDSLGFKVWDKTFGTPNDDRALAIDQMKDSSLIIVGYISYSSGGYKRATISHLTNAGSEINYSELRFAAWSNANDVICTSDSAYVITTEIKEKRLLDFDIRIIKMSAQGDTIWTRSLSTGDMSHPVSIIETFDQGYAIAYTEKKDGIFNSNVGVLKLSPQGKIAWNKVFKKKSEDFAAQIIEGADNSLMVAATNYNRDLGWNFGVLKYSSIEMSDLIFLTPKNNIATVYNSSLPIDAYITGYKTPLEVKIYINGIIYAKITNFEAVMTETNKYLLKNKINLKNGKNIIDFVVTDYKKYKFVKTLQIYYLPEPVPRW